MRHGLLVKSKYPFIVIIWLFLFSSVYAKDVPLDKTAQADVKVITMEEAQGLLENSIWEVEFVERATANKKETVKGNLRFSSQRVASDFLEKKGFSPTSCSIRIKNNRVIWETMQTSEKNGIAFLRGDLKEDGESMRGVLSWHIDEKNKKDYMFMSKSKEVSAVSPIEAPVQEPKVSQAVKEEVKIGTDKEEIVPELKPKVAQAAKEIKKKVPVKVEKTTAQSEVKKKRGWFW